MYSLSVLCAINVFACWISQSWFSHTELGFCFYCIVNISFSTMLLMELVKAVVSSKLFTGLETKMYAMLLLMFLGHIYLKSEKGCSISIKKKFLLKKKVINTFYFFTTKNTNSTLWTWLFNILSVVKHIILWITINNMKWVILKKTYFLYWYYKWMLRIDSDALTSEKQVLSFLV